MLKMIMESPDSETGYSDYMHLQDTANYEILNGLWNAVPAPGTKHQCISMKLTSILFQKLENKDLGTILGTPCRVMLTPWDIVQPDILFIRKNRKGIIGSQIILGPPDLTIEILSDGTWERDLKTKRRIYADSGIQEYWIVDPETETIEPLIWSEVGYISLGIYGKRTHVSSPLLPGLRIPVSKVFAP